MQIERNLISRLNITTVLMIVLLASPGFKASAADSDMSEHIVIPIGESTFSMPKTHVSKVNTKGDSQNDTRDSSNFFMTTLCLPDLAPKRPKECDNSEGWGNVIEVLVSENAGKSYKQFYREVVEDGIQKNCFVLRGISHFSSDYYYFVDKNCGVNGPGKERSWNDVYLLTSPPEGLFFIMRCKKPRENYYPSCRVRYAQDELSTEYYIDRKHLDSFT